MANATGAFGLRPVRHISGAPWNGATVKCYISANYATALFVGDPVLMDTTLANKDTTGNHPTIIASAGTAGTLIRGVIVGFEPNPDDLNKQYSPASTEGYAYVAMDPDVVFAVRGDGGGTPSKVFPGQNAVLIATAGGSTATGLSGFHMDEGTTTAPTTTQNFTLHILNVQAVEDNTLADNAVYEVLLNTVENATGRFLGVTAA
jgi:hypothetical protein